MNIFKILSDGDGNINEPNVSSFLAYLLDPQAAHGLSSKFLEAFLQKLVLKNRTHFKELIYESKISELSSKSTFNIYIQKEVTVSLTEEQIKKNKRRDIDVIIEIWKEKKLLHLICIENKIKDSAASDENQLIEEVLGIQNKIDEEDDENNSPPKLSLIFLTKDYGNFTTQKFNKFSEDIRERSIESKIMISHMIWEESKESESYSVFSILQKLLEYEARGEIDPIHEYTKYTVKSFMNFISSGFKSYQQEKPLSDGNREKIESEQFWKMWDIEELKRIDLDLTEYFKLETHNISCTSKRITYKSPIINKQKSSQQHLVAIVLDQYKSKNDIRFRIRSNDESLSSFKQNFAQNIPPELAIKSSKTPGIFYLSIKTYEEYKKYILPILKNSYTWLIN